MSACKAFVVCGNKKCAIRPRPAERQVHLLAPIPKSSLPLSCHDVRAHGRRTKLTASFQVCPTHGAECSFSPFLFGKRGGIDIFRFCPNTDLAFSQILCSQKLNRLPTKPSTFLILGKYPRFSVGRRRLHARHRPTTVVRKTLLVSSSSLLTCRSFFFGFFHCKHLLRFCLFSSAVRAYSCDPPNIWDYIALNIDTYLRRKMTNWRYCIAA